MTSFLQGFGYPFRSFSVLKKHPRLLQYILIPFTINASLFTLVVYWGLSFFDQWATKLLPGPDSWWHFLYYLVWVVVALAVALIVFFTFVVVGSIISAPFNDLLSERTEQILSGRAIDEPFVWRRFVTDIVRTVLSSLGRIWLYVLGMIPILILMFAVPGVGPVAGSTLSFLFTCYFLVVEYTSFFFDRKGYSFKQQRQYIRGRRLTMMGFGVGVFVLLAIPFLQLLVIPLSVIGGTALCVDRPVDEPPVGRPVS